MNRQPRWRSYLSGWVIGGGILIATLLLAGLWVVGQSLKSKPTSAVTTTPVVKIVKAPTLTPVIQAPTQVITTAPTPGSVSGTGTAAPIPPMNSSIKVGLYVQISGTGGEGLRLRAGAGVNQTPRLLGHEAEVFQVQDGPKEADGYTWWYLVAPADSSRNGWAVSNYLTIVQNPS